MKYQIMQKNKKTVARFYFKITQKYLNYLVVLYKDDKEYSRNCFGEHSHAVLWGKRAKANAIKAQKRR